MSTIALICWKINCIRTSIIISYLFKALPLYVVWWFLKVYEVFNIDIIIWCSPKQCFGFTSTSILTLLFFLSLLSCIINVYNVFNLGLTYLTCHHRRSRNFTIVASPGNPPSLKHRNVNMFKGNYNNILCNVQRKRKR